MPHTLAVEMTLTPGAVRNVIGAAPISSFLASCARDHLVMTRTGVSRNGQVSCSDSGCKCFGDCNGEICDFSFDVIWVSACFS